MDDMAAYYSQPQPAGLLTYHQYYQPPPPQPPPLLAVVPPPPGAVVPPAHHGHPPYVAQHQQQAVFGSYGAPQPSTNEVRTLFVAGLPEDVKPREIYNLFHEFPGYESSHLRSPTNSSQPFAFAVFASQQSAIMAMHALNGMVFDLEKGSTLFIDLAKSNSRSKRTRIDDERTGADKKARSLTSSWITPDSAGVSSIHMPGMGNPAFNTNTFGYPPAQSLGSADGSAVNDGRYLNMKKSSAPYIPQNSTPCATLFVANLGPSCNEQELMQVFSRFHGFLKLKMQSTYGAPVAFVDFQDANSSTEALNSLQGTILHSSQTGEGMRLEYAKSRMGMRKKPK
ncbi:U2 small nuclear ribonucleoprotein B'' isoform X1 [Vigna unguiculata]|uniref:U2 small nuclear ribonucleoprotein B'' isoform X1 n=1 Tax=Vigna unguiculata TaxID=3917 RepID=UPI001017032C|nr:U2 small nuclear ribonucleoprotein B'' isoform X1 [Vigna unguiculata]